MSLELPFGIERMIPSNSSISACDEECIGLAIDVDGSVWDTGLAEVAQLVNAMRTAIVKKMIYLHFMATL